MINTVISLVMTLIIAATLGSQFASTAYRATSVRATLAGGQAAAMEHHVSIATEHAS